MKRIIVLAVALMSITSFMSAGEARHQRRDGRKDAEREHKDSVAVQPKYDGAHISFVKSKHNFGEVKRRGGDLKAEFEYVNDGTEPLVITRIATSCTCIRTDYRRRPLDVGESAVIELTYEPHKMEAGAFHKVVQVYSNSVDGMHLLTVSGNSVEREK